MSLVVSPDWSKTALRSELKAQRADFVAGLDALERTRLEVMLAARISGRLTGLECLASYAAFGSEISPAQVAGGLPTVLPRVAGLGLPLAFHHTDGAPLVMSRFGVAEPRAGLPDIGPDIVLVPLLGVDRRGNRIGYGAGHYDRTLAALRLSRRIVAIGCAWDCQLVDSIPAEDWDEPLDAVATPTQYLTIAAR